MWLLQDNPAPSHMTIDNFMKNYLSDCIESIQAEINAYIFEKENIDLTHIYIDGTKITANANKYVKQYVSDMDCFIPLMEKCRRIYGFYPKYTVWKNI